MKYLKLRKLQKIWTKEWILKFISVILAVVLWYFVGGEDKVDKNVMIPIEVINLPRDLVISNQYKKTVDVTVTGPRSLILEMAKMEITRQVDLSNAEPGSKVIDIPNDSIKLPRGITVQRVQPASIILSLDKLIQKQFQIIPQTAGKISSGYELTDLVIDPDVITITGPQSQLSQYEVLLTTEININNLRESVQMQVPLDLEAQIVELIGETSVTVDVGIGLKMVEKRLEDLPVQLIIDDIKQKIAPDKVTVVANIPEFLANNERRLKEMFAVTTSEEGENGTRKVQVIPVGDSNYPIEILRIIPAEVRLEIVERKPTIDSESVSDEDVEAAPERNIPVIKSEKIKELK